MLHEIFVKVYKQTVKVRRYFKKPLINQLSQDYKIMLNLEKKNVMIAYYQQCSKFQVYILSYYVLNYILFEKKIL